MLDKWLFDMKLIELPVVKATECRRQAAQHPNERELRGDDVNDKAEPRLLGEREAMFGFCLHLRQRLAGEEQVRVQILARVGAIREVADPVRRFERAAQQITAGPHMFRPAHDINREVQIRARLEAFQPASFDEIVAELAEAKSGLVVAEERSGDPGEHDIGNTRSIAVATLEAETDRFADRQANQVRIRMRGRRHELAQNVDGRQGCRVVHQRQIDEILDCPAAKQ